VGTRDWNLMLNSSSSLTGGQTHTHGCGMQFERFDSLNDSVVGSFCQKPFNLEGVDFNVNSRCKVILDLLK